MNHFIFLTLKFILTLVVIRPSFLRLVSEKQRLFLVGLSFSSWRFAIWDLMDFVLVGGGRNLVLSMGLVAAAFGVSGSSCVQIGELPIRLVGCR